MIITIIQDLYFHSVLYEKQKQKPSTFKYGTLDEQLLILRFEFLYIPISIYRLTNVNDLFTVV